MKESILDDLKIKLTNPTLVSPNKAKLVSYSTESLVDSQDQDSIGYQLRASSEIPNKKTGGPRKR